MRACDFNSNIYTLPVLWLWYSSSLSFTVYNHCLNNQLGQADTWDWCYQDQWWSTGCHHQVETRVTCARHSGHWSALVWHSWGEVSHWDSQCWVWGAGHDTGHNTVCLSVTVTGTGIRHTADTGDRSKTIITTLLNIGDNLLLCDVDKYLVDKLLLTDDWLPVVTRDIVEAWSTLDNDGETVLSPLGIVGLTSAPGVLRGGDSTGPGHWSCSMVDATSSPEVWLTLTNKKVGEFSFLGRVIKRHETHAIRLTVSCTFRRRERVASEHFNVNIRLLKLCRGISYPSLHVTINCCPPKEWLGPLAAQAPPLCPPTTLPPRPAWPGRCRGAPAPSPLNKLEILPNNDWDWTPMMMENTRQRSKQDGFKDMSPNITNKFSYVI